MSSSGFLVVGGKHRAKGRQHDIERVVGKANLLGITFEKRHRDSFGGGPNTPDLEQAGNVIDRRHLAPSTRGSNGRVPGAGRHIEHGLTAAQIDGLRRASRLRSESLRQLSDSRPPPTLGAVLFHVAHCHVSLQNCAAF